MNRALLPALLASLMLQVAPASAATSNVDVYGVLSISTTVVANFGQYSVSYDDSSIFGGINTSFGGGNQVGFGWSIPTSVLVVSTGGAAITSNFALPDFTVTANPGYALSGNIGGFMGNLVYSHFGASATTSANVSGALSVDGSGPLPVGGALTSTPLTTIPGVLETGYYSATTAQPYGSFTSFSFSGGVLSLSASGGTAATITSQPQNVFQVSFNAIPVPEPETYALMLAGLGLVGFMARRRKV